MNVAFFFHVSPDGYLSLEQLFFEALTCQLGGRQRGLHLLQSHVQHLHLTFQRVHTLRGIGKSMTLTGLGQSHELISSTDSIVATNPCLANLFD